MNSSTFSSDDESGIEARARVLDILDAANTAHHPFDEFEVQRSYDRKGNRCVTTFIDSNAANYGDNKTRITIILEIDENESPALLRLVDELTEAELAEARAKALEERESAQAAAAAAQSRLDALDALKPKSPPYTNRVDGWRVGVRSARMGPEGPSERE